MKLMKRNHKGKMMFPTFEVSKIDKFGEINVSNKEFIPIILETLNQKKSKELMKN